MVFQSFSMSSKVNLGPASRHTTLTPFCANSLPSVPPPAPEPTITTTESSFLSKVFAILSLPYFGSQPISSNPRLMYPPCSTEEPSHPKNAATLGFP